MVHAAAAGVNAAVPAISAFPTAADNPARRGIGEVDKGVASKSEVTRRAATIAGEAWWQRAGEVNVTAARIVTAVAASATAPTRADDPVGRGIGKAEKGMASEGEVAGRTTVIAKEAGRQRTGEVLAAAAGIVAAAAAGVACRRAGQQGEQCLKKKDGVGRGAVPMIGRAGWSCCPGLTKTKLTSSSLE